MKSSQVWGSETIRGGSPILLLVNGPGELWGWGRPLAAALGRRGLDVHLRLLPCQFAGGEERLLLERLASVRGEGPEGYASFLLRGGTPPAAVVQLGGEIWGGRRVAKRWGVPLICYTYGFKRGLEGCDLVATAFDAMAAGLRGARCEVVGDLVADALAMDRGASPWNQAPLRGEELCRLVLFPGSRPAIRREALNFLRRMVARLREGGTEVFPVAVLSPAVDDAEAERWREGGMFPWRSGAGTALPGAHLAVTQPGTNTLELLHCATPGIVVVPDEFLDKVPLGGIAGLVARLPGVGPLLRRRALARWRGKFLSWPNRLAQREILWEAVGSVTPESLARRVSELWIGKTERENMTRSLRELRENAGGRFFEGGAAEHLAAKIAEMAAVR